VECAVHSPFFFTTNAVAGVPEFWSYAKIGGLFNDAGNLSVLYFPADFSGELEIIPIIVYAPGFCVIYQIAVFGIGYLIDKIRRASCRERV